MEISKQIKTAYKCLAQGEIVKALSIIKELLPNFSNEFLQNEFHNATTTYGFLLSYFIKGVDDPQRKEQTTRLTKNLFKLLDEINLEYNKSVKFTQYYSSQRTQLNNSENFNEDIRKFLSFNELNNLAEIQSQEYFGKEVFDYCWLSNSFSEDMQEHLKEIILKSVFGRNECNLLSLIFGGIFLSLNETFNEAKLLFLIKSYIWFTEFHKNEKLRIRILLYICLVLYVYRHRLKYYKSINDVIKEMLEVNDTQILLRGLFNQLHIAKNTEKTTRKVQEGLMASLKNIPDEFVKKMGDNITAIDLSELDLNPEWEKMMKDSGVTKNIERLSELKESGGDILMATFENLKFYKFFQILSNWFLPFDVYNSSVYTQLSNNDKLKNTLIESHLLCDSDKYSLALSMANMQDAHIDLMCAQFEQHRESDKAAENDFDQINSKYQIESVVQDLYRFYKLYSRKTEYLDFFKSNLNLHEIELLKDVLINKDTILSIAENYLINEQYEIAINYYKIAETLDDSVNIGLIQKIGYCYQNLKNYNFAIEYYLKCQLINDNDLWNLRHLAICFKNSAKYEEAINYYKKCLLIDEDNISLILQLGHCYFLIKKYQEALNCYHKVNYLKQNDVRALRPIAWITFVMGNLSQSEIYYNKIIEGVKANGSDSLNMGHLQFAKGQVNIAVENYSTALRLLGEEAFTQQYKSDSKVLNSHYGISFDMIQLVYETVMMKNNFLEYLI